MNPSSHENESMTSEARPTTCDGYSASPSSAATPVGAASSEGQQNVPPHKRPYVNIYAQSAQSTKAAVPTERKSGGNLYARVDSSAGYTMAPPTHEDKPYVNIYARPKVSPTLSADAQAIPAPEAPPVSPFEGGKGIPYYGELPVTAAQTSTSYRSTVSEDVRAERLNLLSLILGIFAYTGHLLLLTCLTPFAAVLAIIFACKGRQHGSFDKKGKVGFILGVVFCAIVVAFFILMIVVGILSDGEFIM